MAQSACLRHNDHPSTPPPPPPPAAESTVISVASATVRFSVGDREASLASADAAVADLEASDRADADADTSGRPMIATLRAPPVLLPSANNGDDLQSP